MEYFIDFSIGLKNAWIGSLIIFITMTYISLRKSISKRMLDMSWYEKKEKVLAVFAFISEFGFLILTIWLPLKIGTAWFYIGVVFYAIGFVGNIVATYNYSTTPEDEVITKGMYKLSRNPLYLFWEILTLGLVIATASLPLLAVWIFHIIINHLIIVSEEKYCIRTYGDSYKDYMKKVPRYFLFF